jgi:hypothetical protein
MPDPIPVVVSGFGYKITHVAMVPPTLLEPMSWPGPSHRFTGIGTPLAAICTKRVRSVQPVVIVMREGTPVLCPACAVLASERHLTLEYPAVHEETKDA